jgi:hypothetical protein
VPAIVAVSVVVAVDRRFRGSAIIIDERKTGAQAGQRRISLDMKLVDGQVRAVDQPVLPAERHRPQEQPLEQLGVDEPPRLGVADRLVHRQPLREPVAKEAADVHAHRGDPQQLSHRADPLQRADQHQPDQHDRIDRRTPHISGVVRNRLPRARTPKSTSASSRRSRSSAGTSSSRQTISTCNVATCPFTGPIASPEGSGSGGRRRRSTMGLKKTAVASKVELGKVAAVQA